MRGFFSEQRSVGEAEGCHLTSPEGAGSLKDFPKLYVCVHPVFTKIKCRVVLCPMYRCKD